MHTSVEIVMVLIPGERDPSQARSGFHGAMACEPCRSSHINDTWRNITEYGTASTDDGAIPDDDAWSDECVGGHPYFRFDGDFFRIDVKGRTGVVVRAGTDVGTLRDDGAISNFDLAEGVEDHLVADVAEIADFELPGICHPDRGPKDHASADAGPEQSQQPSAPAVKYLRRHSKQGRLNDPPQLRIGR